MKDTVICEGDLVAIYINSQNISQLRVHSAKTLANKYGTYPHSAMIGKKYGTKISNVRGDGFIFLLRCTSELWTKSLLHRTQVVYGVDIAFVLATLEIATGIDSVVIEAGTGSCSFSHSVIRALKGSQGHLFSFEYHKERWIKACAEFQSLGVLGKIILTQNQSSLDLKRT